MGWSINSVNGGHYWIAFNIAMEKFSLNKTWASVNFDENQSVLVPKSAGIYMICSGVPNFLKKEGQDTVLKSLMAPHYVGKTNNLRRRILEHINSDEVNIKDVITVFNKSLTGLKFYYLEAQEKRIEILECLANMCFMPKANRSIVRLNKENKEIFDQIIFDAERSK